MARSWALRLFLFAICLPALRASCPLYPTPTRLRWESARTQEKEFARFAATHSSTPRPPAIPSANFIDDHIFSKMAAAGIQPAPLSSDTEFLRRLMLDLTGRIPSPDQVREFTASQDGSKRLQLIDSLLGSPAYTGYWTLYFSNRFQVTSGYYNLIGIDGRNLFHNYLRDFIQRDRPYDQFARELIAASGDTHRFAPPNFIMRGIQQGDPIQDTWDTLTNAVTSQFLGVQTQCVSCHDGRRFLDDINLYLTSKRRTDFMRQSAFFSRMVIQEVGVDAFGQQRKGVITDLPSGVYHGQVNPNNPGARPPRAGAYEPSYLFTEEQPASGEWRRELARIITADRQFARAAVNYLWEHFFRTGIVNPANAWDLARINPQRPPPAPWTLQPTHPELLEALADFFINNGYRLRPVIRLIVESSAYQLSSKYEGQWRPEYSRYFAKHFPRRLSAEEIYDAMAAATGTEAPMSVIGFDNPIERAVDLPDPTEPRTSFSIRTFLTRFGRGDWWQLPTTAEGSTVQVLFLMNDFTVVERTLFSRPTRVSRLLASTFSDDEAVTELFLATLGRPPTSLERETLRQNRSPSANPAERREFWLSDIAWALLNRAEFLFNH